MEADADLAWATTDGGVRSALVVKVLTEDNVPVCFRTIERLLDGPPKKAATPWPSTAISWPPERSILSLLSERAWPRCPPGARLSPHSR